MLHIFNRTELFHTMSLEKRMQVCTALKNAGIEFSVKTFQKKLSSAFFGNAAHTIRFAEAEHLKPQYYIFVHKKDFELARHIIQKALYT